MAGCRQVFEGPYGLWLRVATTYMYVYIYIHSTSLLSLVIAVRILCHKLSQESREWQEVKNLDLQK